MNTIILTVQSILTNHVGQTVEFAVEGEKNINGGALTLTVRDAFVDKFKVGERLEFEGQPLSPVSHQAEENLTLNLPKLNEMKEIAPDLFVQASEDGVWMHFKSPSGKSSSLNLDTFFVGDRIVDKAIREWAHNYLGIVKDYNDSNDNSPRKEGN